MRVLLLCLVLGLPVWAQSPLTAKIKKIVGSHRAGVAIVHLPSGERTEVDGRTPYPLASVFKLPVMIELVRQIEKGQKGLSLDRQLTVTAAEKCVGSGTLQNAANGTPVRVERLVELMETISDNTATDMLFKLIGYQSVNAMMAELGLKNTDIFLTNRQAWLISLGQSSDFKGLSPAGIAAKWKGMNAEQRHAAALRAEKENLKLSLSRFQALEDASAARNTHAEDVLVAGTVDNMASAADLADLLVKLQKGELLNQRWTRYCLDVLGRQKYNTRIPRNLPEGVRVYHKTGTIAGVVNDAGLIELGDGSFLAVVVLVRDVGSGGGSAADQLIGRVAKAAYDHYR